MIATWQSRCCWNWIFFFKYNCYQWLTTYRLGGPGWWSMTIKLYLGELYWLNYTYTTSNPPSIEKGEHVTKNKWNLTSYTTVLKRKKENPRYELPIKSSTVLRKQNRLSLSSQDGNFAIKSYPARQLACNLVPCQSSRPLGLAGSFEPYTLQPISLF